MSARDHLRSCIANAANIGGEQLAITGVFGKLTYIEVGIIIRALASLLPPREWGCSVALLQDQGPLLPVFELACALGEALFVPLVGSTQ